MEDFIFIIIVIFVLFRVFRRTILVYTVNSFQNKMNEQMRKQQEQFKRQQRENNGKVKVDYVPPDKSKKFRDNDGDYVDYEEIK